MRNVAFIDRDGTLVRFLVDKRRGPRYGDEVDVLTGAMTGCALLKELGFTLAIVTNQPDVARGKIPLLLADTVTAMIASCMGIKHSYSCYHDDSDHCCCRKPNPGLIYAAAYDLDADMSHSVMIGDSDRDEDASELAGVHFIRMKTNGSLLEAVRCL